MSAQKITGLWSKKMSDGRLMLSGNIGPIKILIFPHTQAPGQQQNSNAPEFDLCIDSALSKDYVEKMIGDALSGSMQTQQVQPQNGQQVQPQKNGQQVPQPQNNQQQTPGQQWGDSSYWNKK